jgi:hypothetical protein
MVITSSALPCGVAFRLAFDQMKANVSFRTDASVNRPRQAAICAEYPCIRSRYSRRSTLHDRTSLRNGLTVCFVSNGVCHTGLSICQGVFR